MTRVKSMIKAAIKGLGYEIRPLTYRIGENIICDVKNISDRNKSEVRTIFDIGANQGQFALEALKMFRDANVYGFEPHPKTYQKLISNVSDIRFMAFEVALSDKKGEVDFFDYGGAREINSLSENARFAVRFNQKADRISVYSEKLDDFCERNLVGQITLLKIDTEGGDYRVLKGGEKMLRENRIKFIYFEFNDFAPKSGSDGGSLQEIASFLAGFGFKFVATYTDYAVTDGDFFTVANCLMYNDAFDA